MQYMKWNCLWVWMFFAVCTVVPGTHLVTHQDLPVLDPHVIGWRSYLHALLCYRGACNLCVYHRFLPSDGRCFHQHFAHHSSAWTEMIPSISNCLLLIHQRLSNVTSTLLPEGISTSQGILIFSVILASTSD